MNWCYFLFFFFLKKSLLYLHLWPWWHWSGRTGITARTASSAVILEVRVVLSSAWSVWVALGSILSVGVVLVPLKGKEIFNFFLFIDCAGSFGVWRPTHRVPPTGDKVLPTVCHLHVGRGVPALISSGSWDSLHPGHGRWTSIAVNQRWIGREVAGVGLSNVWSAAGLGALLISEMIRGATVAGCIFGPVQVWSVQSL